VALFGAGRVSTYVSLMADVPAPARSYTEPIYRKVAAHLELRGMSAEDAGVGCARC
jgi:hypothetical protein